MTRYFIEPQTRKYNKWYGFFSFARNLSNKYGTILLDTATKTGLDSAKNTSQKVVCKTAVIIRELIQELTRSKIAEKIVKPKHIPEGSLRNVEDIIIPPEKRHEILNTLRQQIITRSYSFLFK